MRSLRNVSVKEAIIHIFEEETENKGDRKEKNYKEARKDKDRKIKKVISEQTVKLQENPDLRIYFEDLIGKASEDGSARAAAFTDAEVNKPLERCRKMFESSNAFTAGSEEFSTLLYDLLKADSRIKDGDLVACRFTAKAGDTENDFLAILKLLPIGAYRNIQKLDSESGRMFIDMEVDPFIFLNDANVLQKAALISRQPCGDADPQVLILDKQYKHGEIARFFKEFLGVALVRDPAELTLNLYTCLIHSLNDIRDTLTPELDKCLGISIYEIFSKEGVATLTNREGELELYDWVGQLEAPPAIKRWLERELRNEFQDDTAIKLDLSLVEKYIRRRSFSGQDGSTYHMPTSSYTDLVQSVRYVTDEPGAPPYYEVKIRTSVWREETNK